MSKYKSQLKAWAVDRVIRMWEATPTEDKINLDGKTIYAEPRGIKELSDLSDELVNWAYIAEEDLDTTAKQLLDLVAAAEPGKSKIDALIHELQYIHEQRVAKGIDKMEETNVTPH